MAEIKLVFMNNKMGKVSFLKHLGVLFTSAVIGTFPHVVTGQNTMPAITSVIPVSPNAASLGKYADIPVSNYTGIPNISVLLYEISSGTIKLPVSISYHAGGLKVEEIPSWVGAGWSLNAGGVILRQVRGLPDETGGGYLNTRRRIASWFSGMSVNDSQAFLVDIADGQADSQNDLYTYNLSGEAGKFMYDTSGQIISTPLTKNKFEYGNYLGISDCWKVTDVNGTVYYFTAKETVVAHPVSNGTLSSTPALTANNSWYLTKIVSATGTDVIDLVYEANIYQFNTGNTQTGYVAMALDGECAVKLTDNSYTANDVAGQRLSQINFKNGFIKFYKAATQREDCKDDYALDSIVIANNNRTFYKRYRFHHSYTTGAGFIYSTTDEELKRIFLDSVSVFDRSGFVNSYKFAYNKSINLPARNSYGQDHWGYNNGATNNTNFLPNSIIQRDYPYGDYVVVKSADRNVDTVNNQAGILQSITYPTGGRTVFEYETNRAGNLTAQQDQFMGFRDFAITALSGVNVYSGTFTVNEDYAQTGGTIANILIHNGGGPCAEAASLGCPVVTISGPGLSSANILFDFTRYLAKGTYTVNADLSGVTDPSILSGFNVKVEWAKSVLSTPGFYKNVPVGGIRIKRITTYADGEVKASVKRYNYINPDSVNYSSGQVLSFPKYVGSLLIHNKKEGLPGGAIRYYDCSYKTVSSGSNYPMLATQGNYVGYQYVQELIGENGEGGKTEYAYTSPELYGDIVPVEFPFAPSTTRDWKRGQLLRSRSYAYSTLDNSYQLVQERINTYLDSDPISVQGIKTGEREFYTYFTNQRPIIPATFQTESGLYRLETETVRVFDPASTSSYNQSVTTYQYGANHHFPVASITTNSKGETVTTVMKYPSDYGSLTGTDALTAGISGLKAKNILSPIIEKYTILGTDNRLTNAMFTAYKSTIPLPDIVYTAQLSVAVTGFSPSVVIEGSISKSSLYKPQVAVNVYDSSSIADQQKVNDVRHAYVWDYLHSYPIAEVVNADIGSIAYTSFEADAVGGWSFNSAAVSGALGSVTGNKAFQVGSSNTITRSGLNTSQAYVLTYWLKSGGSVSVNGASATQLVTRNSWSLYQKEITGTSSVTISGSGVIDELRLYPKSSQMNTLTYDPLIGVTSQCDANNKIQYYEYDSTGRLSVIRDADRNIIRTLKYNYQK